jgi:hypothetical protein
MKQILKIQKWIIAENEYQQGARLRMIVLTVLMVVMVLVCAD